MSLTVLGGGVKLVDGKEIVGKERLINCIRRNWLFEELSGPVMARGRRRTC